MEEFEDSLLEEKDNRIVSSKTLRFNNITIATPNNR